jgi:hypothetical protein
MVDLKSAHYNRALYACKANFAGCENCINDSKNKAPCCCVSVGSNNNNENIARTARPLLFFNATQYATV